MTPRPKRRDRWRKTKNDTWRISIGQRGLRVTLFENTKGGCFYREVHGRGGKKVRKSLRTRDKEEALRMGRQLYAVMLTGSSPKPPLVLRLGELVDAFGLRSPMFLDNSTSTKADTRRSLSILRAAIGEQRDVSTLNEADVRQYEARRTGGGISFAEGKCTKRVRRRSVQADVKYLKQVLNWACTQTTSDGQRWLNQNPIQHVRVQGERDPQRPVADYDRFEKTSNAMRELQRHYASEAQLDCSPKAMAHAETNRKTWLRAELGLTLIEATGRRRGAIMALRWSDFDFAARTVTWRPESDKARRTAVVEYPQSFIDTVRTFQRGLGSLGGCLFPSADDPERPTAPEMLSQWICKAERRAGLPKLAGGVTHPYRRKWRSERGNHPIKAVMLAGGWSDPGTVTRCYDHPDDAAVLAVTSEPRKRGRPLENLEMVANA
jgi:integrase